MEQRRKYDREFKAQAVQLCEQEDVPITQIARELGPDIAEEACNDSIVIDGLGRLMLTSNALDHNRCR